jgi:hypothetical protein
MKNKIRKRKRKDEVKEPLKTISPGYEFKTLPPKDFQHASKAGRQIGFINSYPNLS